MNLHVFCIHISIMLLLQYALSKSLPENIEIDSILSDSELSDTSDDAESIHETDDGSFKRSKNDRLKGHIRRRRASEEKYSIKKQCAVMYKNNEPVGILQPYKDSYQFLPVRNEEHIPVEISPYADAQKAMKRDTSLNTEDDEDSPELGDETLKQEARSSRFSDERYPYIFAKFKVDSRVEKPYISMKQRALHKRESSQSSVDDAKRSDALSSTLSKIKSYHEGAEIELRNILSDMGLIEDETQHVDKREAEMIEDEDLEHGTNKINLIEMDNTEERSKREEVADEKVAKRSETATKHYEAIEIPEPKTINEEEYIDQYLNKNDQPEEQKKEIEKRSDDVAIQMEREIKSKLQKIKEEVRNEIEKIKSSNNEEFEDSVEDDEEQSQEKDKLQRKKRHVISTLVDEETSDIDPVLNGDNSLVPHIRRIRKRSLTDKDMLPPDDKADTVHKFIESTNKAKLDDKKPKNAISNYSETISETATTETNLIFDLFPQTEGAQKSSSFVRHKRKIDKATLEINDKKNLKRDKNGKPKRIPRRFKTKIENSMQLKPYDMILDGLAELETLELGAKSSDKSNRAVSGNLSYESSTPTNQYYATTEKHFLMRNLKEYDDESIDDDDASFEENNEESDKSSDNDKSLIRGKKSCKCNNGNKDCKCGKAPLKLLKGNDGVNFVYIDDVPRLADGPPSFKKVSSDNEENKNSVKMKLRPIPDEKKRAIKENMKYHRTVVNFAKDLRDGRYTLDIDPDVYRITEENSKAKGSRRKRNNFEDLVEIHGGGPIIDHLVAIRERSMLPRIRVKRSDETKDQTEQQLTLTDMSEEDIFGALPQNFEGELARFKRVKRTS